MEWLAEKGEQMSRSASDAGRDYTGERPRRRGERNCTPSEDPKKINWYESESWGDND